MKLSGARILIETLIEQGTEVIFGYPGGYVLNIYDELYLNSDRIKHVISAHEQGAAHAADGYARASGKVGVVLATSGPGATNLVTGIANAYLDSVPMVAITGNVPNTLFGRDTFQEVDIMGVTLPITKHNYVVKDISKLADTVREAFKIAKSGRPGPVLIDIPKDVQADITEYESKEILPLYPYVSASEEEIQLAAKMITECERPFIYCGGGVVAADAEDEVIRFADIVDSPVGTSMMGLSAISADHPRNLGMMGMHGHYASTMSMNEADLIIALGVRFSDRATGNKSKFAPGKKIIHIDVDNAELNKNITSTLGINAEVKNTVKRIMALLSETKRPEWQKRVDELRNFEAENQPTFISKDDKLNPYKIIDAVNAKATPNMPISTDVGQHQLWVAQRYKVRKPRRQITSGGLGTMGFGLGAAIGACIAAKERTILFTGDGSFGMNLNELATAVSQNLPVTVMIINNGVLGNVRQWQTMFYNKHYSSTTLNRKTDFVKLAEAFGAKGFRASTESELESALENAFKTSGTVVIDCLIEKDEMVMPMIPPGGSVEQIMLNY